MQLFTLYFVFQILMLVIEATKVKNYVPVIIWAPSETHLNISFPFAPVTENQFRKILVDDLEIENRTTMVFAEENIRIEDFTLFVGDENPFAKLSNFPNRTMHYYASVENATKVLQNFSKSISNFLNDKNKGKYLVGNEKNFEKGLIYITNLTGTKDIRNRMNTFSEHAKLVKSVLNRTQSDIILIYTGHYLYVNKDEVEYRSERTEATKYKTDKPFGNISLSKYSGKKFNFGSRNQFSKEFLNLPLIDFLNMNLTEKDIEDIVHLISKENKGKNSPRDGNDYRNLRKIPEILKKIKTSQDESKFSNSAKQFLGMVESGLGKSIEKHIFINKSDIMFYASEILTLNYSGEILNFTHDCNDIDKQNLVKLLKFLTDDFLHPKQDVELVEESEEEISPQRMKKFAQQLSAIQVSPSSEFLTKIMEVKKEITPDFTPEAFDARSKIDVTDEVLALAGKENLLEVHTTKKPSRKPKKIKDAEISQSNETATVIELCGPANGVKLAFHFVNKSGYWSLEHLQILDKKDTKIELKTKIVIPLGHSYHCPKVTYKDVKRLYYLNITGFQIQAFLNGATRFGNSFDCIHFFTPPIITGIFIMTILAGILIIGITWILDIKPIILFDDVNKTKPLPIPHDER